MARLKAPVLILVVLSILAVVAAACGAKATPTTQPTATLAPTPRPTATTGAQPTAPPSGGDATRGKAVWDAQGCVACHKIAGTGGVVGPDLSKIGTKDDAYLRRAVVEPDADVAAGFPPGIMPKTFGTTLSSQQIGDLVAYLKSLK